MRENESYLDAIKAWLDGDVFKAMPEVMADRPIATALGPAAEWVR